MPKFRTIERNDDVRTAKRIFIIGALFACSFGVLFSRAVYFHLKNNDDLERVAMRQYRTAVNHGSKRGKILDASGRELAIDITAESIYANPREVEDAVVLADKLAKTLSIDRKKLYERLSTGRKFVWVKRRVDEKEARAVMDKNLKGIYSMRESSRSYPGKKLASSILGAVGFDSEPLGGVELSYNDVLSAKGKGGDVKRDARGHLYLSPADDSEDPKLSDVQLTIDRTLQYIAERELSAAVEKSHSKGGAIVVMDANSGAMLAMANVPTFDPNNYEKFSAASWKNRVISDAYEPGSTFKTVIVASALDAGLVSADDVFDCEMGSIRIGSKVIRDSHAHGKLSVADIIKVSSNIGAYKIEQRLGYKRAHDAIRAFGFGSPTKIDLPGESPGLFSQYSHWSELQFATIAFGQGIAATPIQMTAAFAAIANGGTLYRPYVIKRVTNKDGDLYVGEPKIVGRPIGEATSKKMAELLTRVTLPGGTGTMAASLEYPVAGKTGTAQKADPRTGGYSRGKYYSSFIGFAPADKPRIVVYVGLDEPAGGMYYGGQIAAPVFKDIVDATLHYFKVPGGKMMAALGGTENASPPKASMAELAVVEALDGTPKELVQHDDQSWRLPNLSGLTMRGILELGLGAEIAWRFVGSGVAVRQSPAPGSIVNNGAECVVEFSPLM